MDIYYKIGDSYELSKELDDNSIDMVLTSPPYDDLREYGGFVFNFKGIADQLKRVLKPGGIIVWVVGDSSKNGSETGTSFRQALYFKEIGLNLHDTMIYEKSSPSYPANNKSNRYSQVFEYMFILSKGAPKTVNLIKDRKNKWGGESTFGRVSERTKKGELKKRRKYKISNYSYRFNIWRINKGYGNSTKDNVAFKHPAIFPDKLAHDHIITWSNPGDIILDPFLGSGTTLRQCRLTGRKGIGFEINPEYEAIIRKRLMADVPKIDNWALKGDG